MTGRPVLIRSIVKLLCMQKSKKLKKELHKFGFFIQQKRDKTTTTTELTPPAPTGPADPTRKPAAAATTRKI